MRGASWSATASSCFGVGKGLAGQDGLDDTLAVADQDAPLSSLEQNSNGVAFFNFAFSFLDRLLVQQFCNSLIGVDGASGCRVRAGRLVVKALARSMRTRAVDGAPKLSLVHSHGKLV